MMSSTETLGFLETGGSEGDFLNDNLLGLEDWGASSGKFESTNFEKLWYDDHLNNDALFNFNETSSNSGDSLSSDVYDIWLNGDIPFKLPDGVVIKQEPHSPMSSSSTPSSPEHEMITDDFLMTINQATQQPSPQQQQPSPQQQQPSPQQQQPSPQQQQQQQQHLITVSTSSNLLSVETVSSLDSKVAVTKPATIPSINTALLKGNLTKSHVAIKTEPVSNVSSCNVTTSQAVNANNFRPLKPMIKLESGKVLITTKPVTTTVSPNGAIQCPAVTAGKVLVTNSVNLTQVKSEPNLSLKADHPPTDDSMLKAWKRQQRMIKNRESASLSRKRKKEHLQGLEGHIKQLLLMNNQLRFENANLKKRVQTLESEGGGLKPTPMDIGSAAKKASCLLAVLFFLAINLGPFSLTLRKRIKTDPYEIPIYKGRSLLQYNDKNVASDYVTYRNIAYDKVKMPSQGFISDVSQTNDIQNVIDRLSADHRDEVLKKKERNRLRRKKQKKEKIQEVVIEDVQAGEIHCPTDFNKTEVSRLNEALAGLAKRIKKDQVNKKRKYKKYNRRPKIPKKLPVVKTVLKQDINCTDDPVPPQSTLPTRTSRLTRRPLNSNARNHEIQLFHRGYSILHNFKKSIHRKEDTFYVVSFKRDHLILPAIHYNDTQRPKVSFLIPASSLNESSWNVPEDHVPMMQIDCQVMDTKIVNVSKENIPPQFVDKNGSWR